MSELTLNEYQEKARSTATYPAGSELVYPLMGLAGEAGELAEKTLNYLFPAKTFANRLESQLISALEDFALAGKECERLKKVIRDQLHTLPPDSLQYLPTRVAALTAEQRDAIMKEAGDVMWYNCILSEDLGASFAEVGETNIEKLMSRKKRGVIQGAGDQR